MLERFETRAKKLKTYNRTLETILKGVFSGGAISMMYNVFASGKCKSIHDEACFNQIDKNSASISTGLMLFYPLWESVLSPILCHAIKYRFNAYDERMHNNIVDLILNIIFKGTFYSMFAMFVAGVTGSSYISNWEAAMIAMGCFVFAVVSNKQLQDEFILRQSNSKCCYLENSHFFCLSLKILLLMCWMVSVLPMAQSVQFRVHFIQ